MRARAAWAARNQPGGDPPPADIEPEPEADPEPEPEE